MLKISPYAQHFRKSEPEYAYKSYAYKKRILIKEKICVTKIKIPRLFPDFPVSLPTLPDFTRLSPSWEYHPFSRFSLIVMNPRILLPLLCC